MSQHDHSPCFFHQEELQSFHFKFSGKFFNRLKQILVLLGGECGSPHFAPFPTKPFVNKTSQSASKFMISCSMEIPGVILFMFYRLFFSLATISIVLLSAYQPQHDIFLAFMHRNDMCSIGIASTVERLLAHVQNKQ